MAAEIKYEKGKIKWDVKESMVICWTEFTHLKTFENKLHDACMPCDSGKGK